ncbi:MAG: hypothetical protein QM813_23960 [Verrucomicrobiota bacterium]
MKKIALAFALLLTALPALQAQVTAEVVMEQEFFLNGEEIPVEVRITNRSGQTLHLGEEADWLTFSVESRAGEVVAKNGDVPVQKPFELASGKTAIRRVEVSSYFLLNRVGRYQLNAHVRIKDWDAAVTAKPKGFEIINAAKIWSQDFGMPQPAGVTNQAPEVRRYTLEQANYLRGKLRMYLRVTDPGETRVFKVLHLGPMVSISDPEHQVDRGNRLHILYQYGARTYLYSVITPDGELVVRQTHEIASNRPRLQLDEAGGFTVVGGTRRIASSDLPAPVTSDTNALPEEP